jgi:hypothetical protein
MFTIFAHQVWVGRLYTGLGKRYSYSAKDNYLGKSEELANGPSILVHSQDVFRREKGR